MTLKVEAVRAREFPWMEPGAEVFLNAASTGPLPARCVEAVQDWVRMRATPQRLADDLLFTTLAKARSLVARLIGASPGEIALAVNTGYGLNVAARALPFRKDDVILTPDREFPANVYPWWASANERGLEYRRVPLRDGVPPEETLLAAMQDERVKCVSVSWVDFATGARLDLARIGKECRERGIWFVVDGIQGVGTAPLDVSRVHVDILACGGQKWLLSPWGTGFVYVREELIPRLEPPLVSWTAPRGTDDFRHLLDYDMTWRDDARRFEFITLPFHDFAGLNASLELFFELGLEAVHSQVERLASQIVNWAGSRNGVELVTPPDPARRSGIVSVRVPDAADASARLKQRGIAHSFREGAIRLSPHFYNTADDIQAALSVLDEKA